MNQTTTVTNSFTSLWYRLVDFLPQLLAAIIVLIIGLLIAYALAAVIKRAIDWLRIDQFFNRIGLNKKLREFGIEFSLAGILAWLVKWFVILATFISVADILKLQQISQFLNSVVLYLPKVFVAIFIVTIGFIVGEFVKNIILKAEQMSNLTRAYARTFAMVSEAAIVIFAILAALIELEVATSLVNILFTGIIASAALAAGLAFGLGGRDNASRILDNMENEAKRK